MGTPKISPVSQKLRPLGKKILTETCGEVIFKCQICNVLKLVKFRF